MLLDPLEEKLHLPSIFVEGGDGQGWKSAMIGQKHQRLAGFGIPEADAPQVLGVILAGVMAIQGNGLVADNAGRAIRGAE